MEEGKGCGFLWKERRGDDAGEEGGEVIDEAIDSSTGPTMPVAGQTECRHAGRFPKDHTGRRSMASVACETKNIINHRFIYIRARNAVLSLRRSSHWHLRTGTESWWAAVSESRGAVKPKSHFNNSLVSLLRNVNLAVGHYGRD